MDNLEINLDDEFKNIDISSSNNNNNDSTMGIDLLMGSSPKKSENDVKSVKSDDMNSPNINNQSNNSHNNFNQLLTTNTPNNVIILYTSLSHGLGYI